MGTRLYTFHILRLLIRAFKVGYYGVKKPIAHAYSAIVLRYT